MEIVGRGYQVFGTYQLPPGYELAYVPQNAVVTPISRINHPDLAGDPPKYLLTSNYSFASALVAIIQIVYASATLYRSRGGQVQQYGYAAFGFTVLPYLIMSFVNLLGNMVTPRYSTIYLVHSEIMDEAMDRGGFFEGVVGSVEPTPLPVEDMFVFGASFDESSGTFSSKTVGKLYMPGDMEPIEIEHEVSSPDRCASVVAQPPPTTKDLSLPSDTSTEVVGGKDVLQQTKEVQIESQDEEKVPLILCPNCHHFQVAERNRPITRPSWNKAHGTRTSIGVLMLRLFIGALPLIVIGTMSHFKAGSSTTAQRGWILSWLVVGMSIIGNPYLAIM
ncbi:hypothetical protein N7470_002380 [Penicillium chermesinum]|nr:hypothetical protein N7470_002380 [Penicillium chermesinum]